MLGGASMESHMQQNQDIFLSSTSFLLLEHSPVFTSHLTVAVLRLQMCTTAFSFFTWFLGIQLKSVAPEPSRSLDRLLQTFHCTFPQRHVSVSSLHGNHHHKFVVGDEPWEEEEEAVEQETCLSSLLPHPWGHLESHRQLTDSAK